MLSIVYSIVVFSTLLFNWIEINWIEKIFFFLIIVMFHLKEEISYSLSVKNILFFFTRVQ